MFKVYERDQSKPFDPSSYTKRLWRFTKKAKMPIGFVVLPGLFATEGYSLQMAGVFLILLLEGVTTYFGAMQGMPWFTPCLTIALDIVFAIAGHGWRASICENQNRLVVTKEEVKKENLTRKIRTARFWSGVFSLIIICSGFLKFKLFYDAYDVFDVYAEGAFVFYMLGAVLHIFCTGHFFFTTFHNFCMWWEYGKFLASDAKKYSYSDEPVEQPINTENEVVDIKETKEGNQSIIKKGQTFYFSTYGVLLDRELAALAQVQQTDIAKSVVAKEGVRVQLDMLTLNRAK